MLRPLGVVASIVFFSIVYGEEPLPSSPTANTNSPSPSAAVAQSARILSGNTSRSPNPEWVALLDRLRIQPRAGEFNNGTVNASMIDVFSDSAESKAKTIAIASEYEKALLERAAIWESDIKQLRAQYEAKILAELPEGKREAARNFLETSRGRWAEAADRDAKARAEFIERMRNGARPEPPGFKSGTPNQSAQPGGDASAWMRVERLKAVKQDEETVKSLRGMLGAEDAARFDKFNRVRSIATPGATATPPNRTTNPVNDSVPPGSKPNNAIPAPSSSPAPKTGTVDKN